MEGETFKNDEEKLDDLILPEPTLNKNKKFSLFRKFIFFGVILLVWIIIMITELVIVLSKDDIVNRIGEINCIYEIYDSSQNISILNEEFNINNIYKIIIDNNITIPTSEKIYEFNSSGNHTVKFIFYEDINMDNMFKNLTNLISVYMSSE